MPIYRLICPDCGHNFEANVEVRLRHKVPCARCGYEFTNKVVEAPPVHFKGSGWTPKHH